MSEDRDEILARFRALGIKVTDDYARVQAAIAKLYPMKYRDSIGVDEIKAAEAKKWFQAVEPLRNQQKLQQYVETLYTMFKDVASAMTGATRDRRVKVAKDQFNCDDALAKKWVDRLFKGIDGDGPLPVSALRADARPSYVKLTWKLPRERCEDIKLYRTEVGGNAAQRTLWGEEPKKGRRDDYTDKTVEPGGRYKYTVYSVFQGCTNMEPPELEVTVPVEVEDPQAEFKAVEGEPGVELSWVKPELCKKVLVFRMIGKIGDKPNVSEDLQPADSATARLVVGDQPPWTDRDVVEGEVHNYLFVASFGDAARSDGVLRSASVSRRPSNVGEISTLYDGKTNTVELKWEPLTEGRRVDYIIVRADGGLRPETVIGNKLIGRTKSAKCSDKDIEPGKSYTYAVFAERDGLLSHEGSSSGRVDALADVQGLKAEASHDCVELSWKLPATADRLVGTLILRGEKEHIPQSTGDIGAARILCDPGVETLRDTGVKNGAVYNYLVCCRYQMPDGQMLSSKGLSQEKVTPREAPPAVRNIVLEPDRSQVRVKHEAAPRTTEVRIYRLARPPTAWGCGQVVRTSELDKLGQPITSVSQVSAVDSSPNPEHRWYLPITVDGIQARVGQARRLPIPDVEDLRAFVADKRVWLRWRWPEGCHSVRIARRVAKKPEGPQDPDATKAWEVTRMTYDDSGESTLDSEILEGEEVWYVVYAMIGETLSSGESDGCSCTVRMTPQPWLHYRIRRAGRKVGIEWRLDSYSGRFGGFVIVGNDHHRPLNPSDGTELLRWVPDSDTNGRYSNWRQAAVSLSSGTALAHYRLFLLDRCDYARIGVQHPQDNGHLTITRRFRLPWRRPRTYAQRRAKDIVCPHCFRTFPRWRLHFRCSTEGGHGDPDASEIYPLPGAWWARFYPFYKMPSDFPRLPDGRKFTDKVCPFEDCRRSTPRPLPYTAGLQPCLILGLVGGPGVGKSHYVVSLIRRIGASGQGLSKIHLDEDTVTRYHEMEGRVYENKTTLQKTQISEPALIYSLAPIKAGRRSCMLALYDSAGEFFGTNKDITERTPYLKQSNGIIFMVDPLQWPSLAHRLGGQPAGIPATQVLGNVVNRLRQDLGLLDMSRKIPTPVAIVLTKADVLRDEGLIDRDCLWHLPVFHKGLYNLHLHHDVDAVFGDLVETHGDGLFNTIVSEFQNYAFFGVSATGYKAIGDQFPRIAPFRVEDPMLWLLFCQGVIEGR